MQTKLETSLELLERVRAKHGASWYRLAQLLDTHTNTVYNWKGGHTIVDRKFATKLAVLLEESPEYVLLCLEHERETSPEVRKIWRRLAAMIAQPAASILFGTVVVLGSTALPSQRVAASMPEGASSGMYIKVNRRRGIFRGFRRWLGTPFWGRNGLPLTDGFVTACSF